MPLNSFVIIYQIQFVGSTELIEQRCTLWTNHYEDAVLLMEREMKRQLMAHTDWWLINGKVEGEGSGTTLDREYLKEWEDGNEDSARLKSYTRLWNKMYERGEIGTAKFKKVDAKITQLYKKLQPFSFPEEFSITDIPSSIINHVMQS